MGSDYSAHHVEEVGLAARTPRANRVGDLTMGGVGSLAQGGDWHGFATRRDGIYGPVAAGCFGNDVAPVWEGAGVGHTAAILF